MEIQKVATAMEILSLRRLRLPDSDPLVVYSRSVGEDAGKFRTILDRDQEAPQRTGFLPSTGRFSCWAVGVDVYKEGRSTTGLQSFHMQAVITNLEDKSQRVNGDR